ncbi:Ubiquitin carboxyl-terminal hydrolase 16 [Amphibalanus amphitrite]|uniref:Ubiquitin carboxyl-terminal hydrolase 16 n=1 Tax=Amphibalanus amphitrite TaxID=1232801 RepID=A0A6A4X9T0_AMPAM|nr:Ubiquitin carboxyl-terminal hydrolase 16 [Amphibalanus amphitrite]
MSQSSLAVSVLSLTLFPCRCCGPVAAGFPQAADPAGRQAADPAGRQTATITAGATHSPVGPFVADPAQEAARYGSGRRGQLGEYVLTPSKATGSGRPSKHALKKERKAARRAKKHGPAAAEADGTGQEPAPEPERQPASDSGQELDKQSDVVHAEGDSDADEEDNGDTGPIIFSLLSELDPPPASVSDTAITATRARSSSACCRSSTRRRRHGPDHLQPAVGARPAAGLGQRHSDNGDTGPIIFSLLSELDPPPASVSGPDPPADLAAEELSERLSTLIVDRAGAAAAADSCGDEPGPLTVNGRPSSPVEADASPAGRVPLVGESADKAPNGAPETAGADQVGEKQSSVPAENCGEAVEARENSLGAPNGHCGRAAEEAPREGQSPSPGGRRGVQPAHLSQSVYGARAAHRQQARLRQDNCTELRNKRLTAAEKAAEKKLGTVYSNASKQLLIYSPPPVLTIHLKRFEVCSFSLRKVNRHVQFGERLDLAPFCSSISQDLPQMRAGQRRVLYSLFGVVEHSGRLTSGHYTAYVRVRRRHDQLTVNPARLTTLVTDAFAVACERARQRAEQTRPETTDGPSPVRPAEEGREDGEGEDPAAAPQESQTDQKQPASEPETEPEPQPEAGRWFYVSDTHVTEVTLDKVLKAQAYMLFYERIV